MGGGKKVCAWLLANCEVQLCSALAAMSLLGVVVVCPVMLDPAIETLASSFENAQCQAIYSTYLKGLSNCTWTSCREGCTNDIFSCWHIVVFYMKEINQEPFKNNYQVRASEDHDNNTSATTLTKKKQILSSADGFNRVAHFYSGNITRGLNLMLDEINQIMNNDTSDRLMGFGALYPNQQKCVYPSETVCADYFEFYGKVGGETFPCFVSTSNSTTVVTTVDKVGALRNVFYCLIPLLIASGVFTYLFYRVGLIGGGRARLRRDEELAESKSGQNMPGKNGLPMGPPPGAPKKLRKKFLPKRKDSSKKKRQRKGLKKNMSLKNQLSVKSASSSRRTPSNSMSALSDEGYMYMQQRTSVPKL